MEKIWNFISRHIIWICIGIFSLLMIQPGLAEIRTFLLLIAVESLALALSGLSVFVYTKLDFTKELQGNNLGFIFLGVHVCIGLVVLGVYIAQFAN